jgi:hypothetical protein
LGHGAGKPQGANSVAERPSMSRLVEGAALGHSDDDVGRG